MKKSTNIVLWCLFLFAFFLFARKSNLVPTKLKDVKSSKFLLRQDVTFEGGNLLITIKWSKTIQFGDRILVTPLIKIPDSPLCPVTAYLKMCQAIKADPTDPLFTLSNGKSKKENPQKPTQLSSRSHPRHLVGKRTAQKTPS